MPSVDVVSKVDLQVLDNAINNVKRETSTRYDFKNVKSEITFDRKVKCIHIVTGDDWKVKAITEMLIGKCTRLKLDPKCLDFKEIEPTSRGSVKMDILIKEGIPKETCPARKSSNLSRVLRSRSNQLYKTTRLESLARKSMTSRISCGFLRSRITTFLCSLLI